MTTSGPSALALADASAHGITFATRSRDKKTLRFKLGGPKNVSSSGILTTDGQVSVFERLGTQKYERVKQSAGKYRRTTRVGLGRGGRPRVSGNRHQCAGLHCLQFLYRLMIGNLSSWRTATGVDEDSGLLCSFTFIIIILLCSFTFICMYHCKMGDSPCLVVAVS